MPNKKSLPEISTPFAPYLRRWQDMTLVERNREIVRCAQRHNGYAVSLNLAPAYAETLTGREKPMRNVSQRFSAEMSSLDLRELKILLMLEATKDTARPHLHGVVIPGTVSMIAIQNLFRNAVGRIQGRSGSRQFMSKKLYASDGWNGYIHKHASLTRKLLLFAQDTRLCWVSHKMTGFVRNEYETRRMALRQAANLSTGSASRGA